MKLRIRADLVYRFGGRNDAIFKILAAQGGGQTVIEERLEISGGVRLHEDLEPDTGARLLRGRLAGETAVAYQALVDNGAPSGLPAFAPPTDWSDLPADVLIHLLPSRYCPSDRFLRFVARAFAGTSGAERVRAILDWIAVNIDYQPGVSDVETTAARTFTDRAGVCRDFTHLAVSFCRASGLPARAVAAYAHDMALPDFHAVAEVWLDGGWRLIDPTGLAPIEGLARICAGRDAADIAFLTTTLNCELVRQSIAVEAV